MIKQRYGTYHYGECCGCDTANGTPTTADEDLSESFHIYAIEWRPENITWYSPSPSLSSPLPPLPSPSILPPSLLSRFFFSPKWYANTADEDLSEGFHVDAIEWRLKILLPPLSPPSLYSLLSRFSLSLSLSLPLSLSPSPFFLSLPIPLPRPPLYYKTFPNRLITIIRYLDDTMYHVVTPSGLVNYTLDPTPHYWVLNTAVGGPWGGYPDNTTVFPQYHCILSFISLFPARAYAKKEKRKKEKKRITKPKI
jgi:Glycosyl hydrolases family 16